MRSLALAIHACPSGNATLQLFWPYFQKAGAQETLVIGTTCGLCWVPEGIEQSMIGADIHIRGNHLPLRLLRTFQRLKETKSDWFCVAEYDILFFKLMCLVICL